MKAKNKSESKKQAISKKEQKILKKEPEPITILKIKYWEVMQYKRLDFKKQLKKPILIEGFPGIGNVGKIAMDVIIEETKAELFMKFFSHKLPHSVFVNEEHLVDLPKIEIYYKKINNQDFLFLTGDVQPIDEKSCYEFSEMILDLFKQFNGDYIITLGGIGLAQIPETPKVYITGNNREFINKITKDFDSKKIKHETKIYGIVGPIMGLSGLLLGIAKKEKVNAYALLSETFGHPIYIGLKGAKVILEMLNSNYKLGLKFEKLDKEIKQIDAQIKGLQTGASSDLQTKYKKISEVNYIG